MKYRYSDSVLNQLSLHGIVPTGETPPEFVHDFVNGLYVYEIRKLKQRMLSRLIPKSQYAAAVADLRARYPILSLPIHHWAAVVDAV
ncbi:MAG TPA: hypothetical protein VEZ90_09290 [Blastocatellia bacterium]|nr:hypothetical protein [Blastocatellia bacterium]